MAHGFKSSTQLSFYIKNIGRYTKVSLYPLLTNMNQEFCYY